MSTVETHHPRGYGKSDLISSAFWGAACLNMRHYLGIWTVHLWCRWSEFTCTLDWVCHSWNNGLFFLGITVSFREAPIHICHVLAGQPLLQAAWQQTARVLFLFPAYSSSQALSGRSGCPRAGSSSIPGAGTHWCCGSCSLLHLGWGCWNLVCCIN